MRWIKFVISLFSSIALIYFLSIPIPPASFPLGAFFSPFHGFWLNASFSSDLIHLPDTLDLPQLDSTVAVIIDEREVPHIFAQNERDLAFVQGYMTARERLWQMEFQILAASGRLIEILPANLKPLVLPIDKQTRRKGLIYAAEIALESILADTQSRLWIEAYAEGVNAYINELAPKDLPLEYKILHYQPEEWTPLKTCLLLKSMANMLTYGSYSKDIAFSKALHEFGRDTFDILYPERAINEDPIIPSTIRPDYAPNPIPEAPQPYFPDSLLAILQQGLDDAPHLGSNNWAVSGTKTVSGAPLLANDPHLRLGLPSIWYEVQLSTPELNAYGVSLPGFPGITIGFNDSIAWGLTNAGRDVIDYYRLTFKDEQEEEYLFKGEWREIMPRVEVYHLSEDEIVYDTVKYTHLGPVVYYEDEEGHAIPFTMRWTAYEPSNELLTAIKIVKAHSYDDYVEAIQYSHCPAQNYVFASVQGDIALWQQGLFVNRWSEQGRFILNAADSTHMWQSFIPQAHNPHVLNPERGFVSSANQHPTDDQYAYYYTGRFEHFRNRRLNQLLTESDSLDVKDMFAFQLDNFSVLAADILPLLLAELDSSRLSTSGMAARDTLAAWDYFYEPHYIAPTIFNHWWKELQSAIWKDDLGEGIPFPTEITSIQILKERVSFRFYDDQSTDLVEDRSEIIQQSFMKTLDSLQRYASQPADWQWNAYQQTKISHLAQLAPFGTSPLYVGGYKHILNAIGDGNGPSWRMVVSLEQPIRAYGVYPGGQTGNPGDANFSAFVETWEKGDYFDLWLMQGVTDQRFPIKHSVMLK